MTGGEIVMTGADSSIGGVLYIRVGKTFSRVRNRRGRNLRVKVRPGGGFLPGKFRRPA